LEAMLLASTSEESSAVVKLVLLVLVRMERI
jgi:hypothetical protein